MLNNIFNKKISSSSFETEIKKLQMVPEINWFNGRRIPCSRLIMNEGKDIKVKKMPMGIRNFLQIIIFRIEASEYIYFEQIIESSGQPIIDWFQLEKIDKSIADVYKTYLLLSSDDQAKTQGGALMMVFDKL